VPAPGRLLARFAALAHSPTARLGMSLGFCFFGKTSTCGCVMEYVVGRSRRHTTFSDSMLW
jgi:hypothetical protein